MIGFQLSNGDVISARVSQRVEFELNSPVLDDDLVAGSHSLEVRIDNVDGNLIKLNNANRHDILSRDTVFNDVRLVVFGVEQYTGKLIIRRIRENGVDAFMVINGFSVEILNMLLREIDYGANVVLGSDPATISTAAAAYVVQNYPDVNFNFPMLYAPNLYNGEALGWQSIETVSDWQDSTAYGLRQLIRWTDNYVYVCVAGTSAGESPDTHPAKWSVLLSNCIINNWVDSLSEFHINYQTYLHTQNAHNICPQMYDKFILKRLESTTGYRIIGEFIKDPLTDQSMVLNTEVLDDVPTQIVVQVEQDCVYDANTNPFITGGILQLGNGTNGYYLHFNNEITDPNNDWTVVDPITSGSIVPSFYNIHSEGIHRITFNLDVQAIGAPPCDLHTLVNGISVDLHQFSSVGTLQYSFEWFAPAANIGDPISFRLWDSTTFGTFDIGPGSYVKIENLSANQYNAWNGTIDHSNHVPDVSVKEYLLALKKRFNLSVYLNFFDKTIELNYANSILEKQPNDFTDIIQDPEADVQQPFGATITEAPSVSVESSDGSKYTVAATYQNYQEMLDAISDHDLDDVIVINNQFAYYRLKQDENGVLYWEFEASKLPPLIYGDGRRAIDLGACVAQLKYLYNDGDMVLIPWFNTQGNTELFGGIRNDKPIVHAIWHGLQDSENGSYQYPFASPAIYDATGAIIGSIDLRMVDGLSQSVWERFYEDWIRKVNHELTFEAGAFLNFKQIFELDFNAPIRRRYTLYILKRLIYEIDQEGNISAEVQAIKVQP